MNDSTWLSKATDYWAREMGCPADDLFHEPLALRSHGQSLADYNGLFALFRQGRAVISFPPDRLEQLGAGLNAEVLTADLLASRFADQGYQVIGPAFIGYATEVLPTIGAVRSLDDSDKDLAESLRTACTGTEWDHGGSDPAKQPCSGSFEGPELAALAGYEVWGGCIAHISVVAKPLFRGRGHGRRAVAHLAARALEAGLVPQYRTLEANTGSMKIAATLGFTCYATSVAVRLG